MIIRMIILRMKRIQPLTNLIWSLFVLSFITICFSLPSVFAQEREKQSEFQGMMPSAQAPTSNNAVSSLPTDNVVSATHYRVGPGDVLLVQIVGPISGEYPLVVSPENTLMLPRLGEVNLIGKTLAQAKMEIQRLVQARNPLNKVYVTLQKARMVYVKIGGNVLNPGIMTLPASMKVSTAVLLANQTGGTSAGSSRQASQSLMRSDAISDQRSGKRHFMATFASRFTQVLHRSGVTDIADAVRSSVLNDPAADPMLREGDEIYVPFENEVSSNGIISISGAVQRPSVIPFRKGDKLSFLLKSGYGFTDDADTTKIFLSEGVAAGAGDAVALSVAAVLSGTADREVQPGSNVIVKEQNTTAKRGSISVLGEVKSPGVFSLEGVANKPMTLKTAIALAGGFTVDAHLPTSYITRRDALAGMDAYKNSQYSTLTVEDTLRYNLDMNLRRPTVVCDFVAAFEAGSGADAQANAQENNVALQDGDVVIVGRNPKNVLVFGQVNKPGFVEFTAGKPTDAYIQSAGGYGISAEALRTRVIKSGSRLWLEPKNAKGEAVKIEAGDQIYVPRIPELIGDLAFKKVQVELQREGNELQKRNIELQESNRFWQIISTIAGLITSALLTYFTIKPK